MDCSGAHELASPKYTIFPTGRVLSRLVSAGYVPVAAHHGRTRRVSHLHMQHVARRRRCFKTVELRDAVLN